jgi:hypothetical protein
MRIHTEIEMLVNAAGAVAIMMPPTKVQPDSCEIAEDIVTVFGDKKPLAKFQAPEGFLNALRKTSDLLAIECLPTRTTRETVVKLS